MFEKIKWRIPSDMLYEAKMKGSITFETYCLGNVMPLTNTENKVGDARLRES